MLRRRFLVRAIMAALAVSATTGVALIFMPFSPFASKVAISAAVLVGTCALLLVFSDDGGTSTATPVQRVWTTWVSGLTALVFSVIWIPRAATGPVELDSVCVAWGAYGLGAFLVALPGLRLRALGDRAFPVSERVAAWGAGLAFGLPFVIQSCAGWSLLAGFAAWLFVTIACSTGLAAMSATAIRQGPRARLVLPRERRLGGVGMAAALAAGALWLVMIAGMFREALMPDPAASVAMRDPEPWALTLATASTAIALPLTLWSVLRPMGFPGFWAVLPGATAGLTAVLGMLATMSTVGEFRDRYVGDAFYRVLYAVILLDICALIAAAVATRAARTAQGTSEFTAPIDRMPGRCPRCRAKHELRPGENPCAGCGLVITVAFRDDRCPCCGYDLRACAAGACPECGRARQATGA